ncbi:MAG: hypothetical protein GXO78_10470 [Calditrichaeota bacterium]|nr:hypothetical protein [Calditrichota bacterium]
MKPYKYSAITITLFLFLSLLMIGCSKEKNPIQAESKVPVQLGIQLENKEGHIAGPTSSRRNINVVEVEISGEGLETDIREKLNIFRNGDRWEAKGTFDLPVGNKDILITGALIDKSLRFDLFEGFKNVDIVEDMSPIIIKLQEITDYEDVYSTFDQFYQEISGGLGYAATLNFPRSKAFLKSIDLYLNWYGNPGSISIFIMDVQDTARTYLLDVYFGPEDISAQFKWYRIDLIWEPPTNGIFSGDVSIGIILNSQIPTIAIDSSPSGFSFYYDINADAWQPFLVGDFAIEAVVQLPFGPASDRQIVSRTQSIKKINIPSPKKLKAKAQALSLIKKTN